MNSNIYQNKNFTDLFLNKDIGLILNSCIFLLGFLSTQRFSFEFLSTVICLVPFIISLTFLLQSRNTLALSFAVLSLVFVSDYGADSYEETHFSIRYVIYSYCLFLLFIFSVGKVDLKNLLGFFFLLAIVGLATLFFGDSISLVALRRDFQVIVILAIIFLFSEKRAQINEPLVFLGFLGYLFGEIFNSIFFYTYEGNYLSYNSLKTIALFPFLYILYKHPKPIVLLILGILVAQVLLLFGTRMIILTTFVFIFLSYVLLASKKGNIYFFSGFIIFTILMSLGAFNEYLAFFKDSQYKTVRFVVDLLSSLQTFDLNSVSEIDRIRAQEWILFFQRPIPEIIIGSGVGSGLEDRNGLLGFVGYSWSSYSPEEINSGIFYNLHDYWTDFGLRFGLIPVIYCAYRLSILEILRGDKLRGTMLGMLLLNATFSMAGLILLSLFFKFFPTSYKE